MRSSNTPMKSCDSRTSPSTTSCTIASLFISTTRSQTFDVEATSFFYHAAYKTPASCATTTSVGTPQDRVRNSSTTGQMRVKSRRRSRSWTLHRSVRQRRHQLQHPDGQRADQQHRRCLLSGRHQRARLRHGLENWRVQLGVPEHLSLPRPDRSRTVSRHLRSHPEAQPIPRNGVRLELRR